MKAYASDSYRVILASPVSLVSFFRVFQTSCYSRVPLRDLPFGISLWGEVFELSAHLQMFLFFFLSSFLLPSSVATLAQPLCLIYDRAVVLVVIGSVVLPSLLGLW